jgi:glyoxylase-like metal-dependent hydrolase (beta-lactamase superfamily II)
VPAEVALDPILCGVLPAPPAWLDRPGGPAPLAVAGLVRSAASRGSHVPLPVGAFLLHHPEAGPVLVDTGVGLAAAQDLRGSFGRLNGAFFRALRTSPGQTLGAQLRARGVDPAAVGRVVMTHLHADHTSGMAELPSARFTVGAAEWPAATARGAARAGFVASHLPDRARVDLVDLDAAGVPSAGFGRTVDLLGDGSIRLVATPGHTPGHLSVLVRTAGRDVLLVGDALYTVANLEEGRLPFLVPDARAYRASVAELRAHAAAHPDTLLVPMHDAAAWRALGVAV